MQKMFVYPLKIVIVQKILLIAVMIQIVKLILNTLVIHASQVKATFLIIMIMMLIVIVIQQEKINLLKICNK